MYQTCIPPVEQFRRKRGHKCQKFQVQKCKNLTKFKLLGILISGAHLQLINQPQSKFRVILLIGVEELRTQHYAKFKKTK